MGLRPEIFLLRNFYPRPPRGGRHKGDFDADTWHGFLSTPSARRATTRRRRVSVRHGYFYPRPPRGGRPPAYDRWYRLLEFLSTPSARRATTAYQRQKSSHTDFYPRPPRGGRRLCASEIQFFFEFLSTPSARRATLSCGGVISAGEISIHALREEGDLSGGAYTTHRLNFYPRPPRGGRRGRSNKPQKNNDFYPRPPRGGRHAMIWQEWFRDQFLSTPSARRATPRFLRGRQSRRISIHALREEGDWRNSTKRPVCSNFYPRPPRGGRHSIPGLVDHH